MPKLTGPMFDGRAIRATEDFIKAAEDAVAEEGKKDVKQRLKAVLQHPTGKYSNSIHVVQSSTHPVVRDGKVYGTWLEGTSSRNKTTRFKGYRTFQRVYQALEKKAPQIAERLLPSYLRRMS